MTLKDDPVEKKMLKTISKGALGLGIFAAVTVGAIQLTSQITKPYIQRSQANWQNRLLTEMLAGHLFDNQPAQDRLAVPGLALEDGHLVRYQGRITASILPVTAVNGYNGDIRLLVAIDPDNIILGVRALAHQETAGIGDSIEIEKSTWITAFNGRSLVNTKPWLLRQQGGHFDSLTRATVTSKAVIKAVERALLWHQEQKTKQADQ